MGRNPRDGAAHHRELAADGRPARHRVGIVMFVAAILFGILERYLFLPGDAARGTRRGCLAPRAGMLAS